MGHYYIICISFCHFCVVLSCFSISVWYILFIFVQIDLMTNRMTMNMAILNVEERNELRRDLFALYRNSSLKFSRNDWTTLADFIKKNSPEVPVRDEFGLSKMVRAVATIRLAVDAIGLKGNVLSAYLVDQVCEDVDIAIVQGCLGQEIADTVSAFRRIDALEIKAETVKTDNFRNLLVSQAGDMRVVLILIAKCVDQMRRIRDTQAEDAKQRISTEAAYIYAPLAHKLGLYKLKSELEDLSLKYLEHEAYYMIKDNLNATKRSRDAYIERFIDPIRKALDEHGYKYHIKGRTKSIHSIWQKMKKQGCGFHGVFDLFAIRIILDVPQSREVAECWNVFSIVTHPYETDTRRLRDWITVPKSNGYMSLHITVRGPEDKWVEVQIRSERMDEIAENGLAAHWRYKGVKSSGGGVDGWLADIRAALETGNEQLLSDSLSTDAKKQEIYVFTPKGDLFRLPPQSTVLDFAYHIHTAVGNRCVGARINGRVASIRQVLNSGEKVEILTSNTQTPKKDWESVVVSSHAKAKIRAAVKDLQTRDTVMAREILERKLKNRKIEWDESVVNQLIRKAGYKEAGDFYRAIAEETVDLNDLIELYQELARREAGTAERAATRSAEEFNMTEEMIERVQHTGEDILVIDRNLKGLDFQMARCCNPVYGDEVFGFVTIGGGIKIHRTTCPNAPALRDRFAYRIVPARWAGKGSGKYAIALKVIGQDDLGIVNNITSIISKEQRIMLRSINIDSHAGLFSGVLTVMVDDTQVLNALIKKLRTVKGVKAVSRM